MKYREIVFLQGEGADEALNILEEKGEKKALDFLLEFDYGEGEITERAPWGSADILYKRKNYVMSYNNRIGYVGLTEIIK